MIWFQRCLLQSCGRWPRRRRGMGMGPTATVRGARRSLCNESRVFSRLPGRRFLLRLSFGFVGGRGPSLGIEIDVATASRSRVVRAPRKKALDPGQGCSITVEPKATAGTARTTKTARKWALVPLPASAQLQLPVSAFLALFLLIWRLLELPCSGHASLCRWLRAWQPDTSRPWQPRPSKGASEAAEGCPNARAAARS